MKQEIVRDVESVALCCSNCDCEDCIVSTYDKCKHEAFQVFPDDDLSDVCLEHWKDWLIGKRNSSWD